MAALDYGLRHAVRGHQAERELPLGGRSLLKPQSPQRRPAVRGDLGAGALFDRGRQAGVVEVMVRDQHELDVLDREAMIAELLLERLERLRGAWTGVDERQRLASQQPHVHAAQIKERKRDLDDVGHDRIAAGDHHRLPDGPGAHLREQGGSTDPAQRLARLLKERHMSCVGDRDQRAAAPQRQLDVRLERYR